VIIRALEILFGLNRYRNGWIKRHIISAGSRPLMDLWSRQMMGADRGSPKPHEDAVVLAPVNDEPAVALTRHH
jgi:hypothetical protein